eukprot:11096686-Alexandrium_andersonii.AAC.1
MAASIAMDTAIPCDHLMAAAWRHLSRRTGRPRFRVEGAGAEARLTVCKTRPDGEEQCSCRSGALASLGD